jgi:hypothetical protein
MNKNQSKYFNTAVKMNKALLTLLEKKEFEYITIKEVCDTAGVNRSTFYLHYENTYDLLEETTKYILDTHFSYYNVYGKDMVLGIEKSSNKELVFITEKYLTPYLTFVKDNIRIFKIAIKEYYVMNMEEVYKNMFKYIFEPILKKFGVPENERNYVIKFYLTGIYAIVMEWVSNDCKDDINFIIKLIEELVIGERNLNE